MSGHLPPERNFLGLPAGRSDPAAAGVIIVPVPFEATSSYGPGSQRGPDAIISASQQVELFDAELGFSPVEAAGGIATLEPMDVARIDGAALCERLRELVAHWLSRGKFVVVLGGEHTSVVGAVRAHCEAFDDLTVLHLDAHSDLRQAYQGSAWNHACAMARVLDFHGTMVQVGVRSQEQSERAFAEEHGLPVYYADWIHRRQEQGWDWTADVVAATTKRVYVTLDCDVMDPSVIPATGTPEPGGLTWQQVNRLLARLCRERQVVGLDMSELAPISGLIHPQFCVAKLIYRFIGYRFGT
jgi:agmatinase